MAPVHSPDDNAHSDIWVAVVCPTLIGISCFSIFPSDARLLVAGFVGASVLAALVIRASRRRDG